MAIPLKTKEMAIFAALAARFFGAVLCFQSLQSVFALAALAAALAAAALAALAALAGARRPI